MPRDVCLICHCRDQAPGSPRTNPVIAESLTELLQRILDSGGAWFWHEPGFQDYGDAGELARVHGVLPPRDSAEDQA